MFKETIANRIEKGRSSYDRTGSLLEFEMLGSVNTNKYREEAYKILHRDELPKKDDTPDQKFEKILHIREMARQELETAEQLAKRGNFIDYPHSMKLIEECQVGRPEKPGRLFANMLYRYISKHFGDNHILRYFTASGGTHLDVLHGIDCFFKLYDQETGQELSLATLDLTMNRRKDIANKAQILMPLTEEEINQMDASQGNEEYNAVFFSKKVAQIGEGVVRVLKDNYHQAIKTINHNII